MYWSHLIVRLLGRATCYVTGRATVVRLHKTCVRLPAIESLRSLGQLF